MNARDELKQSIKNYLAQYWKISASDDELERYLSGVMAFLAVEQWDRPFTPFTPPVIVSETDKEEVKP
jgi:hypothetical protein